MKNKKSSDTQKVIVEVGIEAIAFLFLEKKINGRNKELNEVNIVKQHKWISLLVKNIRMAKNGSCIKSKKEEKMLCGW